MSLSSRATNRFRIVMRFIAALAEGTSEIRNYATAADCKSTLECLRKLGIGIDANRERVRIHGAGLDGLKKPKRALDAENSGSTMRMLSGVLAGQSFTSTITGTLRCANGRCGGWLSHFDRWALTFAAATEIWRLWKFAAGICAPSIISSPVSSAQVKSAILLAGLYADNVTTVREPVRTRDHTEIALREFGASIEISREAIRIHPQPNLEARQLTVPGDLSGAIFLASAALVLPESSLMIHNVGLNPTRAKVLDFLISIGAQINLASVQLRDGELVGDLSVRHSTLTGGNIAGRQVAEMIDELPMLAALGPFTEEGIEISDAQELRVKESDRIATLAAGLRQMGASVEEFADGLRVAGRSAGQLHGAKVDPHGDHRIAMALSIAALGGEGNTVIRDAECVGVSFPEFFKTLERLRGGSDEQEN